MSMRRYLGVICAVWYWALFVLGALAMLPVGLAILITRVFPDDRDGWIAPVSLLLYAVLLWFAFFR